MAIVAAGLVHQGQLDAEIKSAIRKLGPEAAQVSYGLGADSTGEPSVFFRIVLTDAAAREEALADVTGRIATLLFDELLPMEKVGVARVLQLSELFRIPKQERSRMGRVDGLPR